MSQESQWVKNFERMRPEIEASEKDFIERIKRCPVQGECADSGCRGHCKEGSKEVSGTNGTNTYGHGHVFPRPDGVKARCGGPALCSECRRDLQRRKVGMKKPYPDKPADTICNLCGALNGQSCRRPTAICSLSPPDQGLGDPVRRFEDTFSGESLVLDMFPQKMQTRTVIGLTGKAGAGKSTAALYLFQIGFNRIKWAAGLKEMLRAYLRHRSTPSETIERMIEGDLKETPTPYLNGRTPRYAMQQLGDTWGRQAIDANLWVDTEVDSLPACGLFVSDDTRYPNEADAVRRLGGTVVRIVRAGAGLVGSAGSHASETHELPADVILENDGTIEELHEKLRRLVAVREASGSGSVYSLISRPPNQPIA